MTVPTKIAGWALVVAGLVIICWTIWSSYNIFTAQAEAPQFFKAETEVVQKGKGAQDIQAQMEQMIGEQIKGIIPAGSLPQLLNLVVWSMLAFILFAGAGQIAGLGVKLLKS